MKRKDQPSVDKICKKKLYDVIKIIFMFVLFFPSSNSAQFNLSQYRKYKRVGEFEQR